MSNRKGWIIFGALRGTSVPFELWVMLSFSRFDPFANQKAQDRIISGEFDDELRQKCIEKLKSYGFESYQKDN